MSHNSVKFITVDGRCVRKTVFLKPVFRKLTKNGNVFTSHITIT